MQISAKARERERREREKEEEEKREEREREREREKELIFNIFYCDLDDPGACTMHCGRCARSSASLIGWRNITKSVQGNMILINSIESWD